MKICLQRASVSIGDDTDAPHIKELEVNDNTPIEETIKKIVHSGYLPKISGGKATWTVFSNVPIAVIAKQWQEPQMFSLISSQELDIQNKVLRLFFNYHAQFDPDIVYEIFEGLQLKVS
jgi:hypothetical protein